MAKRPKGTKAAPAKKRGRGGEPAKPAKPRAAKPPPAPPPKPKRQRDYAAEYARRVAGTAKGSAERQAKRGHRPPPGQTEAAVRRVREEVRFRTTGQATTQQKSAMTRWLNRQAKKGPDGEEIGAEMARDIAAHWREQTGGQEFAHYKEVRDWVEAKAAAYQASGRKRRHVIGTKDDLLRFARQFLLNEEWLRILFYH